MANHRLPTHPLSSIMESIEDGKAWKDWAMFCRQYFKDVTCFNHRSNVPCAACHQDNLL